MKTEKSRNQQTGLQLKEKKENLNIIKNQKNK